MSEAVVMKKSVCTELHATRRLLQTNFHVKRTILTSFKQRIGVIVLGMDVFL
jgi:hypothetical protein